MMNIIDKFYDVDLNSKHDTLFMNMFSLVLASVFICDWTSDFSCIVLIWFWIIALASLNRHGLSFSILWNNLY